MKKWICAVLVFAALPLFADDGILLQRIIALEARVAELEIRLAPVLEAERVKEVAEEQRTVARSRIMYDAEFLSRHDLNIIEKLYQTASEDWTSEEAGKAVALLTEKFPHANRTGCAVLARAQSIEGAEQLDLLKRAIEKHNTCFYATGVQVGPYARLCLAMRYKKEGKDSSAEKLFKEIRTAYPNAIDGSGQLLTSLFQGLEK